MQQHQTEYQLNKLINHFQSSLDEIERSRKSSTAVKIEEVPGLKELVSTIKFLITEIEDMSDNVQDSVEKMAKMRSEPLRIDAPKIDIPEIRIPEIKIPQITVQTPREVKLEKPKWITDYHKQITTLLQELKKIKSSYEIEPEAIGMDYIRNDNGRISEVIEYYPNKTIREVWERDYRGNVSGIRRYDA